MVQTNTQQQQQKEKGASIDIEQMEFGGTLKTELTTTLDLANLVNSIFKPIFHDYVGCVILPNQFGQSLELSLFFKDKGVPTNGSVKNLVNAVDANTRGASPMDRIRNMNIRNSNKVYSLTDETKEALSEFIFSRPGQNINWNQLVYEVAEQSFNGHQIYVKVCGLDLLKILRKVYGKRNNGSYNDYSINIIKPLMQVSNMDSNYLVSILQLDTKRVEELCKKIGMMPAQGNIAMVRA